MVQTTSRVRQILTTKRNEVLIGTFFVGCPPISSFAFQIRTNWAVACCLNILEKNTRLRLSNCIEAFSIIANIFLIITSYYWYKDKTQNNCENLAVCTKPFVYQENYLLNRSEVSVNCCGVRDLVVNIKATLKSDCLPNLDLVVVTCWVRFKRSVVSALGHLGWVCQVEASTFYLWGPRALAALICD